jgi:hypothetical protein
MKPFRNPTVDQPDARLGVVVPLFGLQQAELRDHQLATAAGELIAAYRSLELVQPSSLPEGGRRTFELLCHGLCTALVSLEDLFAQVEGQPPAISVQRPSTGGVEGDAADWHFEGRDVQAFVVPVTKG